MKTGFSFGCRAAILVSFLIAPAAMAAMPSSEQIEKDLSGPFAISPIKADLSHGGPLCAKLAPSILYQARSQILLAKPWKGDPAAIQISDPKATSIRVNAMVAEALAVVARFIPTDAAASPQILPQSVAKEKAIALLRFVLATHGEGDYVFKDGEKPWKDQWQSAHWAGAAANAAWLLWDDLDPKNRWLAAQMITEEADRFVDRTPDHGVEGDTKAEENAWNSEVLALSFNLFPNHPKHAKWGEAAIRWQVSAYMTSADTKRTDIIDGKPLNQWVQYPNIYDDYTLENHDRVHPDYMTAMTLNIFQKNEYDLAGNPSPQSILFNTDKIYAVLKTLAFPDGGWVYPSGQDWQIHRNPDWVNVHTAMAVLFNDPQAAFLLRTDIDTMAKMIARAPDIGIYQPGENGYIDAPASSLAWAASAYVMMLMHGEGPPPENEAQIWKDLSGVHMFKYGKIAVVRTEHSVSTFSWGSQIMGMVLPLRKDLLCTPTEHGLIGDVEVEGIKHEEPRLKKVNVANLSGGVAITGILDRGNGAVDQRFAFVALGDGRTIYVDSVKTVGKAPRRLDLGLLGILNDKIWVYHDGKRTLKYAGGETVFAAANAQTDKPLTVNSPWFNINDLGIAVLSSAGQLYTPRNSNPGVRAGRLEQLFSLNHPASANGVKPTVLVFYPSQTADKTEEIAGKVKLDSPDATHFKITLEDGQQFAIDLVALSVTKQ